MGISKENKLARKLQRFRKYSERKLIRKIREELIRACLYSSAC